MHEKDTGYTLLLHEQHQVEFEVLDEIREVEKWHTSLLSILYDEPELIVKRRAAAPNKMKSETYNVCGYKSIPGSSLSKKVTVALNITAYKVTGWGELYKQTK